MALTLRDTLKEQKRLEDEEYYPRFLTQERRGWRAWLRFVGLRGSAETVARRRATRAASRWYMDVICGSPN